MDLTRTGDLWWKNAVFYCADIETFYDWNGESGEVRWMCSWDTTEADVFALSEDELEAAVQVFHVRGGRVRGQRGWVIEKSGEPGESTLEYLVEQFLTQFYGDQAALREDAGSSSGDGGDEATNPVPKQVLVPVLPDTAHELETWLCQLRGSRVALRVPQRGDKRALAETVKRNAEQALNQHKLKRAGDFNARSAALQSIQDALGLEDAPLRIECVDISHVQGTDVVASLVVFEDGLPRKSDYRHYAIREAAGDGRSDDVASIAEVTRRRFARHIADGLDVRPTIAVTKAHVILPEVADAIAKEAREIYRQLDAVQGGTREIKQLRQVG